MMVVQSPLLNDLLACMSAEALGAMTASLELVPMRLGERIYEPGMTLRHGYFPTTSVVSLHYVTVSGSSAESASVGHEGLVGVPLFMGGGSTSSSAVVQTAGYGYRIESGVLREAFEHDDQFQRLLLCYTQALMTHICQTAVCNRHHGVEQQLCSWLLHTLDRIPDGELMMTQELVANLLGVRRESVTQAAGHLQDMGYIRYRRGHISVLDRAGLQSSACECYAAVRKEAKRLRKCAMTKLR